MKSAYTLIDILRKRIDDLERKEYSNMIPVNINLSIQENSRQIANK